MTRATRLQPWAQSGPQVRSRVEGLESTGRGQPAQVGAVGGLQGETVLGSQPREQAAPPWGGKCDGLGSERPGLTSL